jgi:BirA family biotin operon repressor/biotin-[acetyl-CoA-carboxylase] ligase
LNSKPLDKAKIVSGLKTQWGHNSLIILDDCDSTNDEVTKASTAAPEGTVVVAETQRAGRGRFGRTWYSPRGGLWFSILIKPKNQLALIDCLPLIGALAVTKVLVEGWGVRAGVRWPNDVVVDGRKIAGILVESKSRGNEFAYAALGIGINANFDVREFEAISGFSTSLSTILGEPIDRERLLVAVISEVESLYELVNATGESIVTGILRHFDWSRGKRVNVTTADRELTGLFDDYESLQKVRIDTTHGPERVQIGTLVSVDYQSD